MYSFFFFFWQCIRTFYDVVERLPYFFAQCVRVDWIGGRCLASNCFLPASIWLPLSPRYLLILIIRIIIIFFVRNSIIMGQHRIATRRLHRCLTPFCGKTQQAGNWFSLSPSPAGSPHSRLSLPLSWPLPAFCLLARIANHSQPQ